MTIDEIVARVDKERLFAKHGVNIVKKKGSKCEGSCPFCRDEKKFNFNSQKGLWKCWACGTTGNTFSLLTKLGHTSQQAVQILKEEAGIEDKVVALPGQKKTPNASAKILDKPVINRIYGRVCELLPLTDIHRRQLKTKRGFTDRTIDRLMFRSLGRHAADIKDKLINEFETEDLVVSGVLILVNNQLIVNNQLLEDRILIPYLDAGEGVDVEDDPQGIAARSIPLDEDREDTRRPPGRGDASTGEGGSNGAAGTEQPGAIEAPRPAAAKPGSKTRTVYHIRPHKLGLEKISPQIYCRFLLQEITPEHVVLTEGEFKAAALWQWKIPAVAVPGISSFGGKHLDRLVTLFREFGVKKITVIFDNEIKDNPEYPNYKPKESDRYDAELWSYLMAYKLGREGFDTKVGRLPDEWRQQGKIDFDGALAQGRTREEILNVIARARPAKEYIEGLTEEARAIVRRKVSQHFTRQRIRREWNKYVATRHRASGESYEEQISNFVIDIKSSFFTSDGVVRNIQLVNEYGEKSDMFVLEPSEMAGLNEFKKFCFAAGNYVFEGKGDDLVNIWKLEFARDSGELIIMPENIGAVKKKIWMFNGVTVKQKNQIFRPDNEGVFWIDGKGYKPRSLTVEKEKF